MCSVTWFVSYIRVDQRCLPVHVRPVVPDGIKDQVKGSQGISPSNLVPKTAEGEGLFIVLVG